jgi:hypothetical integral membrane protein (TIGR02206 family)
MSAPAFQFLGTSHVIVLALTAALATGMIFLKNSRWKNAAPVSERVLALLLLLEWPCNVLLSIHTGEFDRGLLLPAHLCDVAAIIGGIALLTHKPLLCELLYFWGLAGTMQGMITPALAVDFPQPRFFMFFELHMTVIIAALYIVLGARVKPRRGAVLRATALLVVYAFIAGVLNFLLGTNYGFLCEKPFVGSIASYLGPWPWYVGSMGLAGLVLFTLLDMPFWKARR